LHGTILNDLGRIGVGAGGAGGYKAFLASFTCLKSSIFFLTRLIVSA